MYHRRITVLFEPPRSLRMALILAIPTMQARVRTKNARLSSVLALVELCLEDCLRDTAMRQLSGFEPH